MHKWETVGKEGTATVALTKRMEVTGGWLYRVSGGTPVFDPDDEPRLAVMRNIQSNTDEIAGSLSLLKNISDSMGGIDHEPLNKIVEAIEGLRPA